jgi:lipopolysaccharide/colanic/teichoic acid biosynthesis glycosyltransferase
MKRSFDLIFSTVGLVALSPAFVILAAAIRLEDGGPAFYRQTRVGHRGKNFRLWKFRTMTTDADRKGLLLTVGADSRITRVGKLLRRSKLDELPQLINVLVGEMSFVGPRPEVPHYVEQYDAQQRRVLDLKPGITDPASIQFRDENTLLAQAADPEGTYVREIMPEKIRINLAYADRAGIVQDFQVLCDTVLAVSTGRTLWIKPATK